MRRATASTCLLPPDEKMIATASHVVGQTPAPRDYGAVSLALGVRRGRRVGLAAEVRRADKQADGTDRGLSTKQKASRWRSHSRRRHGYLLRYRCVRPAQLPCIQPPFFGCRRSPPCEGSFPLRGLP